jgi:hypothetical protein
MCNSTVIGLIERGERSYSYFFFLSDSLNVFLRRPGLCSDCDVVAEQEKAWGGNLW